jgi:transposase
MNKVVFSHQDLDNVQRLSATMSVEQIAGYFGISKTTYYEVAKRQPELLERYHRGKSKRIAEYSQIVHEHIINGDKDLLKFYLRTQAGWTDKKDEPTTTELPPITIQIVGVSAEGSTDNSI